MNIDTDQGANSGFNGRADSAKAEMSQRQSKENEIYGIPNDVETLRINHDFEQVRLSVKSEFANLVRPILERRKNLVLRLGHAIIDYGHHIIQKEDICMAIKFFLAEEINEGLISKRDIERYCPAGWKRKYNRKQRKSDILSLSEQSMTDASPPEVTEMPAITTSSAREFVSLLTKSHVSRPVNDLEDEGDSGEKRKERDLAWLADRLAEQAAEIARQQADIEELKHEKRELQEQLLKATIKPATNTYVQCSEEVQEGFKEQTADVLRPFSVCVKMDLKGQFLPVIVTVDPIGRKVTVVVDEVKARSMIL